MNPLHHPLLFHTRRLLLSYAFESGLRLASWQSGRRARHTTKPAPTQPSTQPPAPPLDPLSPEDFAPLGQGNFTNPYPYYRLLRDRFPVYRLSGTDFWLVSRYEDIINLARDTEACSSRLTEIMVTGKPKKPGSTHLSPVERLGEWGVLPVDVLAIQDPPIHSAERKIAHSGFNAHFVKALESEVQALCNDMMDTLLPQGSFEFIQNFAWRLPMRLIIRLLGLPEADYERIKIWCCAGIRQLSGVITREESLRAGCSSAQFVRYLWRHYLTMKKNPPDNFTGTLIRQANDPASIMTDQRAVSTLFQLLIAGSDSSASSMGNALRMLVLNPNIEQQLRCEPGKTNDFIEEVFRLESAFQGHFRLTTREVTLHGVTIPANQRVFLLWASGNRDERFWDRPDDIDINRPNGKKHLTFGHGVHACIGRELARMEIRIVINTLLARTKRLAIAGETPFEASMFARTLVSLPLAFELADGQTDPLHSPQETACHALNASRCPAHG